MIALGSAPDGYEVQKKYIADYCCNNFPDAADFLNPVMLKFMPHPIECGTIDHLYSWQLEISGYFRLVIGNRKHSVIPFMWLCLENRNAVSDLLDLVRSSKEVYLETSYINYYDEITCHIIRKNGCSKY